MSAFMGNGYQTGKDLLLEVLKGEHSHRVPWVPFAGIHAGYLRGLAPQEVLKDADKLHQALLAVNENYDPDGQPIIFDLQIEAEILGCDLFWPDDSPPSVVSHPLADTLDLNLPLPTKSDGRLPMVLEVMRRMKRDVGEHTALFGLICGPFTLASHLRGTNIFMDMFLNPDYLKELLAYTRDVAIRVAEMYLDAGMDVIAVVDPLISQIGPAHFQQFMSEPFTDLFSAIKARGAFSSFFVCGDATKNIENMALTGTDYISIDENVDILVAIGAAKKHGVLIGGNIPLTTTLLLGNQLDNMKFAIDLIDRVGHQSFILSPGCDMPYETPVENVIGLLQAVRDTEAARAMVANYHAEEIVFEGELLDYDALTRPLVEVFTLDSRSCAACMYMLRAAERAVGELAGLAEMVEYKYTLRENVARCHAMGVMTLPSIYINGELKFSSIIPSNEELIAAIRKASGE